MFLCLNILVIFVSYNLAQHWTYEEQNNWSQEFHSCGGKGQSPININTNEVKVNPSLNLELIHYDKPHKNMIANNNGHTVRITLNHKSSSPHISGTAVNGIYTFEEIHFHWGDNDFDGTEHLVDNLKGSAEMHIVHYNQKYGSLIRARDHRDGIVVLTVFLEVANDGNIGLEPLMKVLPKITHFNSSAIIHERLSIDKMLPFDRNLFYRYEGSLTTPPCSESVTFILFANPIKISSFQLYQFRRLSEQSKRGRNAHIFTNTRERQHKNGRIVESSAPLYNDYESSNQIP